MSMTDEEKLAALYIEHEPEPTEQLYVVVIRDEVNMREEIIAIFTEEQSNQAYILAPKLGAIVRVIEPNKLLREIVVTEVVWELN